MSTPTTCPHCGAATSKPRVFSCGTFHQVCIFRMEVDLVTEMVKEAPLTPRFTRTPACYEREIAALRRQFDAQAREENDLRLSQILKLESELEAKDARIQRLEAALDGLLEQYDDRKAQWGSEYLWEKHECTEVIEQARAALAREALAAKS